MEVHGYKAIAASQTDVSLVNSTGDTLDKLYVIWVFPATTSPGAVTIKDGATTIATFAGGANSVSNLVPFPIALMARCAKNWSISTGTNVSVVCVGSRN